MTETDPFALFADWYADAVAQDPVNPSAMTLATAGADGRPTARMVLLKGQDAAGFVFYTNLESDKAADLAANPYASLCFYWKPLGRQIRIDGRAEPVSDAEADAYFATRPRGSQLGAWASAQSRPLAARKELEDKVAALDAQYSDGEVPRPPHWSGYRIVPDRIEFWHERPDRLHDRQLFVRTGDGSWTESWLNP